LTFSRAGPLVRLSGVSGANESGRETFRATFDKPGIASEQPQMMADVLDDFAKIDPRLISRIVVLLIGVAWIVSGCQCVLRPDRALEKTRSSAPEPVLEVFETFNLTSLTVIKALGCIVLAVGLIVTVADLYLFAHPELMQ
jgi:hypothetical protein